MTKKVLFVDDDMNILASFKRRLGRRFDIATVPGGEQGLEVLEKDGPIAVVISDQRMPGMDGIQFLREVKKRAPDTVRMMLTGNTDLTTAIKAVNEGSIFRFFTKPCPPEEMAAAIEAGLKQYNLIRAERDLLEQTLAGSVKVLIDVLSLINPEAFQKTWLLRDWVRRVAGRVEVANVWELDIAAMLSPIGLITIAPEIHGKVRDGNELSEVDREIYERAPEVARNLISNIPRMKNLSEMIYYQNKGFDGSGFPDDWVAGKDIPLGGRLLKVLIDLAALGDSPDRASFAELETRAQLYDPEILAAVRDCFLGENAPKDDAAAQEVVKVSAARLKAGARLVSDIETEDGWLVLAAGNEISQAQIERLSNLRKHRKLKEPLLVIQPKAPSGKTAKARA
ncbi:MAG: response regulator [Proteobacteria bacterium]|nr:response regulator [Pseudomonadota bacterium]